MTPHRCSLSSSPAEGADGEVVCKFDNGIVVVVMLMPSAQAVSEDIEAFAQGGGIGTWWCGAEDRIMGNHVPGTWEDGVPYAIMDFRERGLERFTLYVEWSGHSPEYLSRTFLPSGILCSS